MPQADTTRSPAAQALLGKNKSTKSGAPRRAESTRVKLKSVYHKKGARGKLLEWIDRKFLVTSRGSTLMTEFRGGTTAFLSCSNNFVVNATIMQSAGIDPKVSIVSGAFASAVACIMSGFLSNLPLGLVTSVGPNVFIAFSLVINEHLVVDQALAISWGCGLILLLLSLTPVLKLTLALVPLSIKYGLVIGTGLLTAFIGLKNIGVVVADAGGKDIVALGKTDTLTVHIFLVSLVATASMLHHSVKGAILVGMLGATVLYWVTSGNWPEQFVAVEGLTPHNIDFSILATQRAWFQSSALLLMLLFSNSGAVIGAGKLAGLMKSDGRVKGSTGVYIASGLGTMVSAAFGSAPIFVSMSACAGIRDGGRTGLVSIFIGLWSLLTAFFFSPLASSIPTCAIAPVLVLVGVSMTGEAREVHWWDMRDALPAFLCAVFQPFTYSVANGIYAGLGMSITLFITTGTFLDYIRCGKGKGQESMTDSKASLDEPIGTPSGAVPPDHRIRLSRTSLNRGHGSRASLSHMVQEAKCAIPEKQSVQFNASVSNFSAASTTHEEDSSDDEDHEDQPGRIQKFLHMWGAKQRRLSKLIIGKAAVCLGLDETAVQEVLEERFSTARDTDAHWAGGIGGRKAEVILRDTDSRAYLNKGTPGAAYSASVPVNMYAAGEFGSSATVGAASVPVQLYAAGAPMERSGTS